MDMNPDIVKARRMAADLELITVKIGHLREDIERRAELLTPIDGWPGKNAEQRDAARADALRKDDEITALRTDLRTAELRQATIKADLAAFELERRDREWGIRRDLINVLREHGATAALPF